MPRRIGFRKLAGYPVYALAGTSIAAINHEWFDGHRHPPDLRLAGDALAVRRAVVRAAPHPAAARRGRTPRNGGRRAASGAAAPSDRPIDRRRRPRFQQSADDRQRQRAAAAPPHQGREADPLARRDHDGDAARREPDPATADILAPPDPAAERHRSRRAAAGDQGHAQPLAARRHRHPRRRAAAAVHREGRSERTGARAAQSRRQCPRRHAVRRHADHHRKARRAARQGERRRP